MNAIAQPVARQAARPEKRPSSWTYLKTLVPYVANYKGMTALGMLALALMGIVGALPQLIQGIIVDSLNGLPRPLATLAGTSRAILRPILAFYAPRSHHALTLYCIAIVAAMLVKGFFSFWSRWILIGVSREIEYDLRNDLLARLVRLSPNSTSATGPVI